MESINDTDTVATDTESDIGDQVAKRMLELSKENKIGKSLIPSKEIYINLFSNEDGDSNIFKKIFHDKFVYDHSLSSWFYWNDNFWREDFINNAFSSVSAICFDVYDVELKKQIWAKANAEKKENDEIVKACKSKIKALSKRINSIQTVSRKINILKLAGSGVDSLGITGDQWDQNPWLLACPNGCVDLKTGQFDNGNPNDYIKTSCPTKWTNINAECRPWIEFIHQIFDYDKDLVDYIQRFLGYCLTGVTVEDAYVIFYGEHGRNGKSTLLEILKVILGELTYKVPSEFLIAQNHNSNKGPDADMVALRGKRVVWASEMNKSDELDIGRVKQLSGSDTLSARAPYGKRTVQFLPTHKLLTMTNRMPRVPANDAALWHRIHVVPFNLSFIENPTKDYERQVNKDLKQELIKNKSGILAWMVRGCLKWQKQGLNPPDIVTKSTQEYREFEDTIGQFIIERCDQHIDFKEKPKDIYDGYKEWCLENGYYKLGKKQFLNEFKSKFELKKNNVKYFYGLRLIRSEEF